MEFIDHISRRTETDFKTLHEATLTLLKRTGVMVDSLQALEYFAGVGVRIDPTTMRVYPEARHIEAAMDTVPRCMTIYGRRPDRDRPVVMGGDHVNVVAGGGALRVLTLDGQYEPATWEHLRQFNILLDALPNIHMCINQVDPVDHEGPGFYPRVAAEMLIGCTKPLAFQVASSDDVRAMIEMGVAIRGSLAALVEQPQFLPGFNAEPPLHISAKVAEAFVTTCDAGLPTSIGDYCLMGVTAPRTVAGAVVQHNAIQLVAIVLAQAVRRGTPIAYTTSGGSADMHTLGELTSTPHALQFARLATELGRFYGLPVYGAALSDARSPDAQAACERALQLQMGIEAGAHLIQGPGGWMDHMMLSSFALAVIDNDIIGYVLEAYRRPEVSAETLALDAAQDVATDPEYAQLKFASHAHTVSHMREGVWEPAVFDYDNFANWTKAGRSSIVERATAKAREILASHHPDPLPSDKAEAVRRAACRHQDS